MPSSRTPIAERPAGTGPTGAPTPRRLTWTAYAFMAAQGYLLYGIGFIAPYVARDLAVPPWVAALPSTLMAAGIIGFGEPARRLVRRIGEQRAARIWAIAMAGAAALLSAPVSIVPVLVGAFVLGASIAGMLVHVVSALADRESGRLLTRAYLWAMVAASASSLVLSFAARTTGWSAALLVPVPVLLGVALVLPGSPAREAVPRGAAGVRLPWPFWVAWGFLVLSMAAEFTLVTWGPTLVAQRASVSIPDATALASLFSIGMIVGRLMWSSRAPRRGGLVLQASTALAIAAACLLALAPSGWAVGAAFAAAGVGMSAAVPLGSAVAMRTAPAMPVLGSARVSAAMGVSLLVAPVLAGLLTGAVGIAEAWLFVPAQLAGALVLVNLLGRMTRSPGLDHPNPLSPVPL